MAVNIHKQLFFLLILCLVLTACEDYSSYVSEHNDWENGYNDHVDEMIWAADKFRPIAGKEMHQPPIRGTTQYYALPEELRDIEPEYDLRDSRTQDKLLEAAEEFNTEYARYDVYRAEYYKYLTDNSVVLKKAGVDVEAKKRMLIEHKSRIDNDARILQGLLDEVTEMENTKKELFNFALKTLIALM